MNDLQLQLAAVLRASVDSMPENQKRELLIDVIDMLSEIEGIPEFDEISICLVVKDTDTIVYAAQLKYEEELLGYVELAEYKREKLQ